MNRLSGISLFFFALLCTCTGMLPASEDYGFGQQAASRILTIQEAVQMALARSPEVLMAEAQASRASEAWRETRSLRWPQVSTGTGLAYNNGYPLSIEGAAPSIFQIGASQSILSKKNANRIHEAEESGKASRLGTESARNDLVFRTALVYYELHRAAKVAALASARLDEARKQEKYAEALVHAGKVRPLDLTLAQTTTSSARQQLLIAREQAKLAETELRELTGLSGAVSVETMEPRIEDPAFESEGETLYRQALKNSPEILQAEANVRAKEFSVKAEKGERLPQMEIIGEYALFSRANNYDDFFNRFTRNNFLVGLSVQIPLFDGFRTSARVAQSRQEVSEMRYKLQSQKSVLKLNIERSLSALRIARGASDLARSEVQAAKEMVQMSEALLEGGRISAKELDEMRSQLLQKELELLDSHQVLFQRKLELLRDTGSISSAIQ